MDMPSYYTTPSERKLWKLAQRWIIESRTMIVSSLDVGRIMRLLEEAGALDLQPGDPLPAIPFSHPPVTRKPMVKANLDNLIDHLRKQG